MWQAWVNLHRNFNLLTCSLLTCELPVQGLTHALMLLLPILDLFYLFIHLGVNVWYLFPRWRFGSVGNIVGRINEVNQRLARLVPGWVTVCRRVNHLGM